MKTARIKWDCWRYGQSAEAGYQPYLRKGQVVEVVEVDKERAIVIVRVGTRFERVLPETIQRT